MRKSLFQINDGPVYIGYTNGDLWNGWATPYFTLEEAQKIQAEFNQEAEYPMLYDVNNDVFVLKYDNEDIPYIWDGNDMNTEDGKLHLYGIGAYSHIWDELGKGDKRHLAEIISDFLYDFDPYTYENEYTEAYDVIERLIPQFDNIEVFAKAHAIMNTAYFDADQISDKLAEILQI